MSLKKYPLPYKDFSIEDIIYGTNAPFVGIGVFTVDRKYSWPDREGTTKQEYEEWITHLTENGYEVPEEYKNAHVNFLKETEPLNYPQSAMKHSRQEGFDAGFAEAVRMLRSTGYEDMEDAANWLEQQRSKE